MLSSVLLAFLLLGPGRLSDLEDRLLQARRLDLDFDVRASGAFTAELHGRLSMDASGSLQMSAQGSFGDANAQIAWEAAEGRCRGRRNGETLFDLETPHLSEAILLGIMRMGVLHNLARLFAQSPPDHADTGIGDWLTVVNERSDADTLHFDLDVAGQRAATIALSLDAGGLPRTRRQKVEFPGGTMEVVEDYHFELVDRQRVCPACRQALAAYGREVFVEAEWSRIFVCCIDCAERVHGDFAGYLEILHALGEDTERLRALRPEPWLRALSEAAPCDACRGGLCAKPEFLPAH